MAEKEYIERGAVLHELLYAMCGTGYQSRAMNAVHFVPAADVVELPLKIGDVVYASRDWRENGAFLPYQITSLSITQNKKNEWKKNYRAHLVVNGKTIDSYVSFSFDEIGKEVFLTIEEGERCAKVDGERKEQE